MKRGVSSGVHTVGTQLELIPNVFELLETAKNVNFDSRLNDKVFFNPHESIGVGTAVGLGSTSTSTLGDIVKVVGLVTAKDFAQPTSEFQLEITQTFNDFFASWSFGEMDYIDSIAGFQDGKRQRFPTYYLGELLRLELDTNSPLSCSSVMYSSTCDKKESIISAFVSVILTEKSKSFANSPLKP